MPVDVCKSENANECEETLVVSLASYPPRISSVASCIRNLKTQTYCPDKILLWLYTGEFPGGLEDVPSELREMQDELFEIKWTDVNLKPHNKYFWTMGEYADAAIVTVDDDLVYEPTMLEELVAWHREHPRAVIARRTHMMLFTTEGQIAPYDSWLAEQDVVTGRPSMSLVATNGAGSLFPAGCFSEKQLDWQMIQKRCLHADDLWLKVLELQAHIPVISTGRFDLEYIPGTQECGLWATVNSQGGNDEVLGHIQPFIEPYCDELRQEVQGYAPEMAKLYRRYRRDSRARGKEQKKAEEAIRTLEAEKKELGRSMGELKGTVEQLCEIRDRQAARIERLLASREKLIGVRDRLKEKNKRLAQKNRELREQNIRYEERLRDPYAVRLLGRIWRKIFR